MPAESREWWNGAYTSTLSAFLLGGPLLWQSSLLLFLSLIPMIQTLSTRSGVLLSPWSSFYPKL